MFAFRALVIFALVTTVRSAFVHFDVLATQGHSCRDACITMLGDCEMSAYLDMNGPEIQDIFVNNSINCRFDQRNWWSFYQPAVVVEPQSPNFGRCLGWKGRPVYHDCSARHPHVRRLCRCRRDVICARDIYTHGKAQEVTLRPYKQ